MERGGDVGIGQQKADRLIVFHHDLDEFRVGKPEQLIRERVHIFVGQRGVAGRAAQGVVVEFFQLRDEGAQVGAFFVAGDAESAAGSDSVRQLVDARRKPDVRAEVTGNRVVVWFESLRFDEGDVIGGVIWQSEGGTMLETLCQQTKTIQRGKAFRADHSGQTAGARPIERGLEESSRGFEVVFTLEQVKERGLLVVEFVVVTVVEDGEAAHGTSPVEREEKRGLGMLVKRKPLRVQPEAFVHPQGRHPLRNVPIDGERQGEEIPHLPFVREVELDNLHGRAR